MSIILTIIFLVLVIYYRSKYLWWKSIAEHRPEYWELDDEDKTL